ncbi:MAG TPA: AAA family ATPase [Candidatus Nanoarchaeia archaeon]|nr:AAA family ATPase [Candidatus Nanoarchaeia archaeon]
MSQRVYRNSTEVASLGGVSLDLPDVLYACLVGRLNTFLQGDTGNGKTQLAKDAMSRFGNKALFLLGRNDMDTRELYQRINLDKLRTGATSSEVKELTEKIGYHLTVVDELPNCVPAVRAQLFNLFDGFIELNGETHPIGNGYSVGIATGNIGQKFTESSNDLGRALKDRMHVTIDTDHFFQKPADTLDILAASTDPRVIFDKSGTDESEDIIKAHEALRKQEIPAEKYLAALYFVHALDHCSKGSKRGMKDRWPTGLDDREQVSIDGLVFPLSTRAAKSVLRFSQALDSVAASKGATNINPMDSVMQSYRLIAPYSGVLYEPQVRNNPDYEGSNYKAIDAVIANTKQAFSDHEDDIAAGLEMVRKGKSNEGVLRKFTGRWEFMQNTLESLIAQGKTKESA